MQAVRYVDKPFMIYTRLFPSSRQRSLPIPMVTVQLTHRELLSSTGGRSYSTYRVFPSEDKLEWKRYRMLENPNKPYCG